MPRPFDVDIKRGVVQAAPQTGEVLVDLSYTRYRSEKNPKAHFFKIAGMTDKHVHIRAASATGKTHLVTEFRKFFKPELDKPSRIEDANQDWCHVTDGDDLLNWAASYLMPDHWWHEDVVDKAVRQMHGEMIASYLASLDKWSLSKRRALFFWNGNSDAASGVDVYWWMIPPNVWLPRVMGRIKNGKYPRTVADLSRSVATLLKPANRPHVDVSLVVQGESCRLAVTKMTAQTEKSIMDEYVRLEDSLSKQPAEADADKAIQEFLGS